MEANRSKLLRRFLLEMVGGRLKISENCREERINKICSNKKLSKKFQKFISDYLSQKGPKIFLKICHLKCLFLKNVIFKEKFRKRVGEDTGYWVAFNNKFLGGAGGGQGILNSSIYFEGMGIV